MNSFLNLPERPAKPRKSGLTCLIDNGSSTQYFTDVISSHADLIDYVKFGWGTSLVTKDIDKKIELVKANNIQFYFGGTLFEKALYQNRLDNFLEFCKSKSVDVVEISDGTIDIPMDERAALIKRVGKDFRVITEVGYKDNERSKEMHPAKWVEYIKNDLEAGAEKVITEARESGTSGICRANGEVRYGLIEEILASGIDVNQIIFEAPNKTLQSYFLKKVGSNVNLGNIALGDVIGLETLRLGLRSDTLMFFDGTETRP